MNINQIILDRLMEKQDEKYGDFHSRLMPGIERDSIIGVRIPDLKRIVKEILKEYPNDWKEFLKILPHKYYEENNVHMMLLNSIKDYEEYLEELYKFLPYVDNWATCDIAASSIVKANHKAYEEEIYKMIDSVEPYTIRFGVGSLLKYYLDDKFKLAHLKTVASIKSDHYYVNMMIAWYFATALAKNWDATIPYIEKKKLSDWIHRKTIQKAIESYRITEDQKKYLKSFR